MLTLAHARRTRREFLRIGAFGAAFTLAAQLRALATSPAAKPKSAVLIFLSGGPSHLDTYDLKPGAPSEFRGELGGNAFLSSTTINGAFCLRACVINHRSTEQDIDFLVAHIKQTGERLLSG